MDILFPLVCQHEILFISINFLGLFGQNGILPSHVLLNVLDGRNFYDKYWENPTLLHLAPIFGLNVSYCMELFALIGILLSFAG